jgi:ankyrin repeat protein
MPEAPEIVLKAHFDLAAVKRLAEAEGADLEARGPDGETPLQAASHMGRKDIAEHLLASGAKLDPYGAALLGMRQELEGFLGEDPGLLQRPGVHQAFPVLFMAMTGGHVELSRWLIEQGAPVSEKTPLIHAAAGSGDPELVRMLLERGVTPRIGGFKGLSPLHIAARAGHAEVARLLLEAGADPARQDEAGKTPLDLAREGGHQSLAGLLERSADGS